MDLESLVAQKTGSQVKGQEVRRKFPLPLSVPEGLNPGAYFAVLAASSLSAIFLGVQATLVLLMFVKLPELRTDALTSVGVFNFRPEYDVGIYLLGLPLTLALLVGYVFFWNWWLRRRPPLSTPRRAIFLNAVQLGVAVLGMGIFLYQYAGAQQFALRGEPVPRVYLVLFALVAQMVAVPALALPGKFADFKVPPAPPGPAPRKRHLVFDVLFGLAIVLVVYVPSTDQLAGHIFQAERFFHWDFFAMGPALAYKNGAGLGTDAFTFYGLAWPVLFALAAPLMDLSYASMIHVSAIYGCIYFIGVYILLKLLTNRPIWAAAGTLLALRIHLFSGLAFLSPLWRFPSVTVMRRPFDVWFFIALVLYQRTNKRAWLLAAAVLTALAVFFETDTGLYLAAAFGLYWLGRVVQSSSRREELRQLGLCFGVAVSLLTAGLVVASRGSVFSASFWQGWLENLALTSSGYTLMPLIGPIELYEGGGPVRGRHVALFFVVVAVTIAFIAHLVMKLLHRRATPTELVMGCLAFYGFLAMIQFMGRTDPLNLYPVMIPFAVLTAVLLSRLDGMVLSRLRRRRKYVDGFGKVATASVMSVTALAVVTTSLLVHKPFKNYPNVIRAMGSGILADETCLTDVPIDGRFLSTRGPACGATSPRDHARFKREFPSVVSEVRRRSEEGELVAIMDQDGPIFYQAADAPPWGKYLPLFPNLVTKERLATVSEQMREEPPENVLIRSKGEYDPLYEDLQSELFEAIEANYFLDKRIGSFELWRRRGLGALNAR